TKRVKGFVPQFAVLQGLERISPGRNIQLNPYSTLARARFLDEDAPAFVTEGDARVGLDAKVVLRDALTLDATVNPDFSRRETDARVLVTARTLEGSCQRMYSLAGRLRFGKSWALGGQVIRSENRELDASALVAGFGALAELQRDGRHVDYGGRYLEFSPDFAAPLGFVKRKGYRQTKHEWQYKWRPKGSPVVAYGPTLSILYRSE